MGLAPTGLSGIDGDVGREGEVEARVALGVAVGELPVDQERLVGPVGQRVVEDERWRRWCCDSVAVQFFPVR